MSERADDAEISRSEIVELAFDEPLAAELFQPRPRATATRSGSDGSLRRSPAPNERLQEARRDSHGPDKGGDREKDPNRVGHVVE